MIDPVPVTLETAKVANRLRFKPDRSGLDPIDALVSLARSLIEPRAIFEAGYVGAMGENTVDIRGTRFVSPVLRQNLENVNKVFPYIITVGPELERAASAQGDLLNQYYLEEIANLALEQAATWLGARLESEFGVAGLASLSPGSLADWPITEQPKLFSFFGDTERLIGVRLTDSMLMIPRKSISGIFFPSEEGFVACQLCEREKCPGRKAPFKPDHRT
ncbi:MAG TPA: vitamin B12 dependent methionine synthase [Acidobacteriota bacterium]|nr:vitamin B12 dependent methionine synthase [Acidobacteriota bacterium]